MSMSHPREAPGARPAHASDSPPCLADPGEPPPGWLPRLVAFTAASYARFDEWWHALRPGQALLLGFASYVGAGWLLLSLPWSQAVPVAPLDNLFSAASAVSTTGLTTVSVGGSYTFFGQLVLLALFQLGGVGYMTISSFILLARGEALSPARREVLSVEFALPAEFDLPKFIWHLGLFTIAIEAVGTLLLYLEFAAAGVPNPLWSALFHCVSAFATAGFGLYDNSLEDFRASGIVCGTIGVLCYLGGIGFIVIQDAWMALWRRDYQLTFTSEVILLITAAVFLLGTPLVLLTDASLAALPWQERIYAAAFQVMSASTTAGFNTVPIGKLAPASLALIVLVMVVGASPSGTGGGLKTTSLTCLAATLGSILRGRDRILFWGREIPLTRVLSAVASATLYLSCLAAGVLLLCFWERQEFLALAFEAASALGTVGLSLGITGALGPAAKLILIGLMFLGRVGPLTIGLAFFDRQAAGGDEPSRDLAV